MAKQSGFTLIELIVVIIVLGVLSATALPKFMGLQDDAREGAMLGLKAALQSGSNLVYCKAVIEDKYSKADQELSTGLKVRYGYPQAAQVYLKMAVNIDENDWMLSGSGTAVTFTFNSQTEDLSVSEIEGDSSICKLVYTQAAKGERPDISISGCTD